MLNVECGMLNDSRFAAMFKCRILNFSLIIALATIPHSSFHIPHLNVVAVLVAATAATVVVTTSGVTASAATGIRAIRAASCA